MDWVFWNRNLFNSDYYPAIALTPGGYSIKGLDVQQLGAKYQFN
ncbi:hypothetical protein P4S63_23355 [Pseudoalteromonas sp. B193]